MAQEKVHGIVLRYANYREADRMLTILTGERGKISAAARGCRKPSSKIRAACDYLIFGEFMLRPVGNGLNVTSCTVLDSFYDLRTDYNAMCCAFYIRDFCDAVTGDHQENPTLFTLMVRSLSALCHGKAAPDTVRAAFEIKAMDELGLGPSLTRCVSCGGVSDKFSLFSIAEGGVICGDCDSEEGTCRKVLPGSIAALRQLQNMPFDTLHVVKLTRAVAQDLNGFWRDYVTWHLDRRFKTADFVKKLDYYAQNASSIEG